MFLTDFNFRKVLKNNNDMLFFCFKKGGGRQIEVWWIDDVVICSPPQWVNWHKRDFTIIINYNIYFIQQSIVFLSLSELISVITFYQFSCLRFNLIRCRQFNNNLSSSNFPLVLPAPYLKAKPNIKHVLFIIIFLI